MFRLLSVSDRASDSQEDMDVAEFQLAQALSKFSDYFTVRQREEDEDEEDEEGFMYLESVDARGGNAKKLN